MKSRYTIATLGSHSALEICRGAKDEGFATVVIAEKGREQTYNRYFKTVDRLGCVDTCLVLPKFADILAPEHQAFLKERHAIFIPHRSFEAYLNFDYEAIENTWQVATFGNKKLLRIEERNAKPNQYDLLKDGGIRYPLHFSNPKDIDRLVIVKVQEKARAYERAFFLVSSPAEYESVSQNMLAEGKIEQSALDSAVIEEFVVGPQVNFHFFYSPLTERLELIGTDTRRQTNLDGVLRLPAMHQTAALEKIALSYEEAGHIATTVLESLLEQVFAMGEAFVSAAKKASDRGIIGPFALQSIIAAGAKKKELIVIDVSPRMPGSPGITATPYTRYLYGQPISMGQRVAQEIRDAIQEDALEKLIT